MKNNVRERHFKGESSISDEEKEKSLSVLSTNFLRKLDEMNTHSLSVYYNFKSSSEGSLGDQNHASAVIEIGKIVLGCRVSVVI